MQQLKIIAFTHKHTPLQELSMYFLHEESRRERLEYLKYSCDISEIMYLSTCNRIEFIFTSLHACDGSFLKNFFHHFRSDWNESQIENAISQARVYEGEDALRHMYRVASSLDSLVIGEREIIAQVRKAYDTCKAEKLTGDLLRLVVKSTITTAKQVYTETKIAQNPVSVVSLADREIRSRNLPAGSRVLIIGAGETNSNLCKYLVKQGLSQFIIFNRTLDKAKALASTLQSATVSAKALPLSSLKKYKDGFDLLVSCTSTDEKIITPAIYASLAGNEERKKIIVDLSVPSNIHDEVLADHSIDHIDISQLKSVAEKNMVERQGEFIAAEEVIEENISSFRHMHRTRRLEVKMKDVPEKIRQIKEKAINDIFAEEISGLDKHSKEVLEKVMNYMEKKCISVPMVMAKEIILETSS